MQKLDSVRLWHGPAPMAAGDGAEDVPRITPVLPDSEEPTGAVIVCPGGGYRGRAAHESLPVAEWLCSLGLAGIVLDYRVAPYRYPAGLCDARRAIRTVRARADQWNIDPEKVGILGFSAGGHLAISAASIFEPIEGEDRDEIDRLSARPDALIACYPVVTFGEYRHDGSLRNLLGNQPDADLQKQLSLETRVSSETPPAFVWHTADDPAVPVENVLLLARAMRQADVSCALHIFAHGRHGLGLATGECPDVARWAELCADWMVGVGLRDEQ
ncbi:MAG: alpha/beta hydrolase [Phycisphaerae bacterium]